MAAPPSPASEPAAAHGQGDTITKCAIALAAASALVAIPAAGQTVLAMSSWMPPSHLVHKVVLEGFAAEVERVIELEKTRAGN